MKILLYLMLGLVSFVGALALALALTGNLKQETLAALLGHAPEPLAEEAAADPTTGLAAQLQAREEALKQREQAVEQRETQLATREQALAQMRTELEALQQQVDTAMDEDVEQRKVRMQTVAVTLSSMKAKDAAERLRGFPTDEIAEILQLIEQPDDQGDILAAMDPQLATEVLRAMQGE